MSIDCIDCDEKYFVVYGNCRSCGRMCEPPLCDIDSMSPLVYEEFRKNWNIKKNFPDHKLFSVIQL